MNDGQIFVLGMTTIISSAVVLLAIVSAIIGRRRDKDKPSRLDAGVADRLGRMEQAIDSIAVEVERISEGQRFVTKLLAERTKEAGRLP